MSTGSRMEGGGFTRDISTGGIFVIGAVSAPEGAKLELQILFPPFGGGAHGLRLKSHGRVVRIEHFGEGAGFAAVSNLSMLDDAESPEVSKVVGESP